MALLRKALLFWSLGDPALKFWVGDMQTELGVKMRDLKSFTAGSVSSQRKFLFFLVGEGVIPDLWLQWDSVKVGKFCEQKSAEMQQSQKGFPDSELRWKNPTKLNICPSEFLTSFPDLYHLRDLSWT